MSDTRKTTRRAGMTTAGRRVPERPACGALQRERVPKAAHDVVRQEKPPVPFLTPRNAPRTAPGTWGPTSK